jgi:membrane protein implicated in regulation of membrane protease activity
MSYTLSIVLLFSLAIGVLCGILIVSLIYLKRRDHAISSLVHSENIIGCSGTVEIPFDRHSRGKVRVRTKGSLIDFIAFTDSSQQFKIGDQVLVVEMQENRIGVISDNFTD